MTESSTAEDALSVRSEMIQRRGVLLPSGSPRQGREVTGTTVSHYVPVPVATLAPGFVIQQILGNSWWTLTKSKIVKGLGTRICASLAVV